MICPKCHREHENAKGICPHCATPTRLKRKQKEKAEESGFTASMNVSGRCPLCGQEVLGTRLNASQETAALFGWKRTTAFWPDKHPCVKPATAS
jgi:hypothetical protein